MTPITPRRPRLDYAMLGAIMLLALVLGWSPDAAAAETLALFPFELIDTSLEPTRPDETARLHDLDADAARFLQDKGGYEMVATAPVAAEATKLAPLHDCNGCELDLAKKLGADLVALGWVQKVSNLILNLNLQIREVATGKLVRAGSVDIRGNTDESWQRGLRYLMDNRILKK